MKISLYAVSVLFLVIGTCEEEEGAAETRLPACIETIIDGMETEPVQNPPAELWKVNDNGRVYYYIPARCCDVASILIDAQCQVLCSPDGGINGAGDGDERCANIQQFTREVIWRDERDG